MNFKTSKNIYLDKFHISGYKYVSPDIPNSKIYIYNLNNSLFKTITIPATVYPITAVMLVSENIFDLDAGVEYAVQTRSVTTTSSGNIFYAAYVFDETGSTLFFRDSGLVLPYSSSNILENRSGLFFDGTSVKMRIDIHPIKNYEIYNLPGSITCSGCSSGIVNSVASGGG